MSAPCHAKCSSAQPTACATGWCRRSLAIIFASRGLPARLEQLADFGELVGRGAPGRQGLHDELRGGAAEGAIEQIANELALGLLLAQPCLVDVRPVGLVATDEPFLGHDLEHLERRR